MHPIPFSVLTGMAAAIRQGVVGALHSASAAGKADDVVRCDSPFRRPKTIKQTAPRLHKTRREKDANQVHGKSVGRVALDGGGCRRVSTRGDASGKGAPEAVTRKNKKGRPGRRQQ